RQAAEDITFVTILFEGGQDVVQIGRVGLVLPVVLERMEVGLCAVRRWNLPLRSLCHAVISRRRQCFTTGKDRRLYGQARVPALHLHPPRAALGVMLAHCGAKGVELFLLVRVEDAAKLVLGAVADDARQRVHGVHGWTERLVESRYLL